MAGRAASKRAASSRESNTGGDREAFAYVTYGATLTPVGIYRGVSVALKQGFKQGLQVAPVESGEILEDAIKRQEAKRNGTAPADTASSGGGKPAAAAEAAASVNPA